MNTKDRETEELRNGRNNVYSLYPNQHQEINEIPPSYRSILKRKRPRPIKLFNISLSSEVQEIEEEIVNSTINDRIDAIGVKYRPLPLLSSLALVSRKRCGGDLDMPLMSCYKSFAGGSSSDDKEAEKGSNEENEEQLMNGENDIDELEMNKEMKSTKDIITRPFESVNSKDSKILQDYNELIQNCTLSTLQQKNHARYLLLKEETQKPSFLVLNHRSNIIIKEYHKLQDHIKKERELYTMQIWKFVDRSLSRFLLGFTAGPTSHFAYSKSKYILQWKKRWMSTDNNMKHIQYGKCVQQISLAVSASQTNKVSPSIPIILPNCDNDSKIKTNILEDLMRYFSPQLLDTMEQNNDVKQQEFVLEAEAIDKLSKLPSLADLSSSKYNSTKNRIIQTPSLLSSDKHAIHLAQKHNANVIMNDTTYITLLQQLPGADDRQTHQWKIPVQIHSNDHTKDNNTTTKTNKLFVLEDPIPKSSTPRECLEQGFDEAITNAMFSFVEDNDNAVNASLQKETMPDNIQYTYTLITLPPPSFSHVRLRSSNPTCKILIRSIVDIHITNDNSSLNSTTTTDDHDDDDDHDSQTKNNNEKTPSFFDHSKSSPLKRFISLEYFPELKLQEHLTLEEKFSFLIHRVLLQPSTRLFLIRINVSAASIYQIKEIVFPNGSGTTSTFDLSEEEWKQFQNRLETTSRFIYSFVSSLFITTDTTSNRRIRNNNKQWSLFCLPGIMESSSSRDTSKISLSTVSIHMSIIPPENKEPLLEKQTITATKSNENNNVKIDISQELMNAESVYMDSNTLLSCFRIWEWDEDKYPSGMIRFTLPWIKNKGNKYAEEDTAMWPANTNSIH